MIRPQSDSISSKLKMLLNITAAILYHIHGKHLPLTMLTHKYVIVKPLPIMPIIMVHFLFVCFLLNQTLFK